ncbi:MAG: hypothetical protein ACLPX8_16690 [Bryobacteraceae bacterium]
MKVLEHLKGTGTVTAPDGDETRAKYDVQITQDEPEGESDGPPGVASKHISGLVWSPVDPYFVLSHFRKTMMLQMEDGRKFRFFHRDINGSIGLSKWLG